MNSFYKLLVLLLFSIVTLHAFAQADTTDNDPDTLDTKKGHVKFGVSYNNNSVYLGRTDTVTTPGYSASLFYTFKFGLYFSGGLDFIPNRKSNKLDGGNLEVGYDHSFGDLEGGLSFTKLFYNSGSTQVSSSLSSIVSAYADYDIADIITPSIAVNYNIDKSGTGSDFLFNPSLSHDFAIEGIFGENDYLLISPQAGLNAGTQNYYAGYLEKKNRLSKKVAAAVNAAYSSYYNSLGQFKLLDYELTLPVIYKAGLFRFSFTPTYAFAQDSLPKGSKADEAITKTIEAGSPYKSSVFYFSLGVSLKF
jgi:hypothetical protein